MRLNLRLIGLLHGILLLAVIGYYLHADSAAIQAVPVPARKGGPGRSL